MPQDEAAPGPDTSYHYIHMTPQELEQLPPHEQLQACLEYRSLLQALMGILLTPDVSLTVRAVAIDLLYRQAQHIAEEHASGAGREVVYIKSVSERLGLRPAEVRAAYEQLAKMGAIHIDQRQFPPYMKQQLSLPLDEESQDKTNEE